MYGIILYSAAHIIRTLGRQCARVFRTVRTDHLRASSLLPWPFLRPVSLSEYHIIVIAIYIIIYFCVSIRFRYVFSSSGSGADSDAFLPNSVRPRNGREECPLVMVYGCKMRKSYLKKSTEIANKIYCTYYRCFLNMYIIARGL